MNTEEPARRIRARAQEDSSGNAHHLLPAADGGEDGATLDLLKLYTSELSKWPVLSREREFALAKRVYHDGDDEARRVLILSNLRLVVKIALQHMREGMNLLDLIQEGNVGLLHAARKFNPYKGARYSTYAAYWIRAYVLKHIVDSWSLVRVATTQNHRKLFFRLNKERRRLREAGIDPAPETLAATLEVSEKDVAHMETRLSYADVRLDQMISDDGETLLDTFPSGDDVEDIVAQKEERELMAKKVAQVKRGLGARERFILERRVLSHEPVTLRHISQQYCISRERARQLNDKVAKKLACAVADAIL